MKEKAKSSRLLRYLLLAVLATSLAASNTLARYVTTVGGTASFQVAAFVTGGSINFQLPVTNLVPGGTSSVDFSVANYEDGGNCEVGLDYLVEVETTGNLPLQFTLQSVEQSPGANSSFVGSLAPSQGGYRAQGGFLPAVSDNGDRRNHQYRLTMSWPAERTEEKYSDEIDMVTITITAEQTPLTPSVSPAAESD